MFCFVLFCFVIASLSRSAYAVDLSKIQSDSSHRKSDFFVPYFCLASQAVQESSASVSATQTRLYSLYEGMTRQNKSVMANMSGGSNMPRVNPLTIISQVVVNPQNSKILGGIAHA